MSSTIVILKSLPPAYVKLSGANSDTKIKKLLFLYILAEAVLEAKGKGTDFLSTFVAKYDASKVIKEDGTSIGASDWTISSAAKEAAQTDEYAFLDSVETDFDADGNPSGGKYKAKVTDGNIVYTFVLPLLVSKHHCKPPATTVAAPSADVDECPSESESEDECAVKNFKM